MEFWRTIEVFKIKIGQRKVHELQKNHRGMVKDWRAVGGFVIEMGQRKVTERFKQLWLRQGSEKLKDCRRINMGHWQTGIGGLLVINMEQGWNIGGGSWNTDYLRHECWRIVVGIACQGDILEAVGL